MCCGSLDGVLSVTASSVLLGDLQTSMPRMKALVGLLSMQRRSRSMGRCEVLFIIVLLITWGHNVHAVNIRLAPSVWYFLLLSWRCCLCYCGLSGGHVAAGERS